jgi:hypothetical protein
MNSQPSILSISQRATMPDVPYNDSLRRVTTMKDVRDIVSNQ